jgi:hypothetical protein
MGYREYLEEMVNISEMLKDLIDKPFSDLKEKYDFENETCNFDSLDVSRNFSDLEKVILLAFNLGYNQREKKDSSEN